MNLQVIDEEESKEYLIARFAKSDIEIDDEIATYIILRAGNIPYYIQMLAAEVWQAVIDGDKKINETIINEAVYSNVEQKSDYYIELFDKLSSYQKKVLRSLCISGENIYSQSYAFKHRLSSTSSTQRAISSMMNEGIIDKSQDVFYITDPFFKLYLLDKR